MTASYTVSPSYAPSAVIEATIGVDLIKQVRYFGDIADVVRRQFHRDDFMRVGIHAEVKLPPPAARPDAVLLIEPFALAVNLEAGAVDEEMQWLRTVNVLLGNIVRPPPRRLSVV